MRRSIAMALCACGLLTLLSAAMAAEKQARDATLSADKLKFNLKTRALELTGNCRVTIKGDEQATMVAPKITAELDAKTGQLAAVNAAGPVKFIITTKKDAAGVQRKVDAEARGGATYAGGKRIVTLTGGATATITTIPTEAGIEPTRLTGKTLILNIDTMEVEGEEVEVDAQIPAPEEPAPAEAEAKPEGEQAPAPKTE